MDMKIREAAVGDFNEVYPLFEQLWPNKDLNREELNSSTLSFLLLGLIFTIHYSQIKTVAIAKTLFNSVIYP
jgi:hypothetical protein